MNSDIVKRVKKENPVVSFSVLGKTSANKFTQAIKINKEFVNSVILIGRRILDIINLPDCIKKLGYDWGEIGKEGLFLVKKMGDSMKIDCIPFDILGILAIQRNLFSLLGLSFPKFPDLTIINKLLSFSNLDIITPIREILNSLNVLDIRKWFIPDYVYNKGT